MKKHKRISPFTALNYAFFVLVGIIMVYPFWYVVMYSLSDPGRSDFSSLYLWPQGFSVSAYRYAFSKSILFSGFFNSTFLTVVGTAVNMALTVTLAYPLSREYLSGKRYVSAFVVFTMLFSGGMIPTYDDNPDIVKRIMAEIEACRADIGDTFTGMAGINVRPA